MTSKKINPSARTTAQCLHLFGSSSGKAKAASWQLPAPKPRNTCAAMDWFKLWEVPPRMQPMKNRMLPKRMKYLRPKRSLLAPQTMNAIVPPAV